MRRLLTLAGCIGAFAVLGLAETLTGNLIDTSCLDKPKPTVASCQPSSSTTAFGLVDQSGQVLKLDESGNTKAAEAMKNRADRSADPNSTSKGNPAVAKITGTLDGKTIKVDKIEVQ